MTVKPETTTSAPLKDLIDYTWQHGHETNKPTNVDPLISYAFYHQYDATVGDCLAGDTFNKLWLIALPAFLGALFWWYWNVIMRRAAPSPVSLLTIKCQRQRGLALNNLGSTYVELQRFDEAITCYQQSLAIWRETGDRYGEGQTLNNLGNAYQEMGQRDRAVRCWREAAAAMRDAGDHEQAGRLEQRAADAQARRRRWWRRGSRSAGI